MSTIEKDSVTGTATTGHEWDGIKELNNPLPRWWLWVLLATIAWAVAYWVVYPAWPVPGFGTTRGAIGYSSRVDHENELKAAKSLQAGMLTRIAAATPAQIAADPEMRAFALAGGRSAFQLYCSQCHGTGAAGAAGYPNLNDDDWIWGGKLDDIYRTLRYGVRWPNDDTRQSDMPAFLTDGVLKPNQIDDVAEYVLALSGQKADAQAAERGKTVFAENCAACHGESATGNQEVGAPNLSDGIWLYGGDRNAIIATVRYSRKGVMPAWEGRLDAATIKTLAVYVHALGGGK
ncbi:MAG: cytochrome-c oxidase, cbb3-type subunit III [Alphaproteobacteria bacterium]|nr:cytochrome-c oxidase, cbb3-type subunit III [Alphaproteobacteria bacterium]